MRIFLPLLFLLPIVGYSQADTATLQTGYSSSEGADRVPSTELTIPPTAEALQATLYELDDQYHAIHQMHWNVTGPLFISLHELYEEFYTAIAGKMDEVAERKLALDEPADARPAEVAANANLSPAVPGGFVADKETLELLSARHLQISNRLGERIAETGETDVVTQDLLISVRDMIDKQLWMMRSFLK
ncbi:Dps family protein [Lewinella sp. IMCC34191]|uniref:Dps family protein n=1 Tax=Lewinella sp. IMCC34191 TaxID=2259172 RepID=UPI000E23FA04|nr:DNA starvation/stationary phase protection protein [Lewinella sp. IMCC34191]